MWSFEKNNTPETRQYSCDTLTKYYYVCIVDIILKGRLYIYVIYITLKRRSQ